MQKRFFIFCACAIFTLGITTAGFSADDETCPMCHGKGVISGDMQPQGMMPAPPEQCFQQLQGRMNPWNPEGKEMGCMMGGKDIRSPMINSSVTATSDGGVVIMIGNKLFKYDKDLKLTAKAEIKMDTETMPMMKGGKRDAKNFPAQSQDKISR